MHTPDDFFEISDRISVLTTIEPTTAPRLTEAQAAARALAKSSRSITPIGTLVIIGGDTATAILGDEPVEVLGNLGVAIPFADLNGQLLVTKGGGIGKPDTLSDLLSV